MVYFDYRLKHHNDANTTIQPGTYYMAVEPCTLRGMELLFLFGNIEVNAKRAGRPNLLEEGEDINLTLAAGKIVNLGNDDSVGNDDNNDPGNTEEENVVYESVDLGLPSGLLWATSNVGASKPENYGGYYAWGETSTKTSYHTSTYAFGSDPNNPSKYNSTDGKTTLDLVDDVARVKMGGTWRMPTYDEIKELSKQCRWTWTIQNGVAGHNGVGPNGKSIFLPAAGCYISGKLDLPGTIGRYWSSSMSSNNIQNAWYIDCYKEKNIGLSNLGQRYLGFTVRGVMDPIN